MLKIVPYFYWKRIERGDILNSAQINYLQYFFNRKKSSLQEKRKTREISNFRKKRFFVLILSCLETLKILTDLTDLK